MSRQSPSNRSPVRIGEAARHADVSRQTVEYYIHVGLIEPIRRSGSRSRYFDDELIRRIRLIRQLNDTGMPLREIRRTYRHRWR